ncbi:Pectinesterase [Handroanthus impetiginosus]|uniref:Pectinesterase n=1 Tax=Handroanthus impetiginosus TaxID=429701 RepID=A0A2G9H800_9LAMI|nr:Pectinesterase [Handroanthus impetiginosus]
MDKVQSVKNRKNKRKILVLAAFASLLVVAAISVAVVQSHKHETNHGGEAIIKSTCAATLYPELCISTVNAAAVSTSAIKSSKDVLTTALNHTIYTTETNYFAVKKIGNRSRFFRSSSLTRREKTALHDCLEMIDNTLDELRRTKMELKDYGVKINYSLADRKEILVSLFSAAQTNQETCLDGFSHEKADKLVRLPLLARQKHVFRLVSNVLAIIKNLADNEMANNPHSSLGGRLTSDEDGWPKWLSAGDRRLLQASTVRADVTVAADGSGNYRTVSEAVAAVPEGSSRRYVIRIKAGVYRENVEIPRRKTNLMFVGDGQTTIITASRNVVDGSTTFNSATVAYQDTLYVHSLRQFYTRCIISGTVDFIFGNAAAILQDCDIRPRRPNPGQRNMVTAQGRSDPNQNTGIVIQKCRIGPTSDLQPVQDRFPTYLGRPWREYSRTIVMQTEIGDVINPAGWYEWDGNFALNTLFYPEYQNTGPGADTTNRVTWPGFRVLTSASQAQPFTAGNFIAGGSWLPDTGFPYSLGL